MCDERISKQRELLGFGALARAAQAGGDGRHARREEASAVIVRQPERRASGPEPVRAQVPVCQGLPIGSANVNSCQGQLISW